MEQAILIHLSPLRAESLALHLLLVLKHTVDGQPADSLQEEKLELLGQIDQAYQRLNTLSEFTDDESPQPLQFTPEEARALLRAFREPDLLEAAQQDAFYERHEYESYYEGVYGPFVEELEASLDGE
ncbi:hypothetical protein [Phaeodactylibacter sp.]|uniref:hypothetical protein n=1 Tax=Phaeodactylibacter sp. TaxID=1940289 RepID=UPI0025F86BA6|nr:hypothetical protein [Phaeodactylibacter sp.]MCI4647574.1 hypothetical protein [Phaeodactylibacter sp.]MCI5090809.1 hypothetical protein [Phaeodactylibacter sp.]